MPRFDADSSCHVEPLEIILGGKLYTVPAITLPTWQRAQAAAKGEQFDGIALLSEILPERPEVLEALPAQQILATCNFIIAEFNKGMPEPEKNGSGPERDASDRSLAPGQDSTAPPT